MKLSRFWFLLLIFNIFLNLDAVQEWAQNSSSEPTISKEICLHQQWIDPREKEQKQELFTYLSSFALSSNWNFQCDLFPNQKIEIKKEPSVPFSYIQKRILIKSFWSFPSLGRAPPQTSHI